MLLFIVWNPLQVLDLILINSDLIELKRDENDIVWKVIHFSLTSLSLSPSELNAWTEFNWINYHNHDNCRSTYGRKKERVSDQKEILVR